MRLHLKRLAAGAVILGILLVALWIGINNDQLLDTILYMVCFCIISYLIGYFVLKIRIGSWTKKLNLTMIKSFIREMKHQKAKSDDEKV